jgi:hypothetical protein
MRRDTKEVLAELVGKLKERLDPKKEKLDPKKVAATSAGARLGRVDPQSLHPMQPRVEERGRI